MQFYYLSLLPFQRQKEEHDAVHGFDQASTQMTRGQGFLNY